jgi:hypothetical protein
VTEQPERGGAWDFPGRVRPEYAPRADGDPDPGEVVWAWVPYEEDPSVGKDRPLIVIGHDEADRRVLVGLMLSSKNHDGDRRWHPIGAGPWDPEHRPSWVRVDRPLAMSADGVRREGSALPQDVFLALVEEAAAAPRHVPRGVPAGTPRGPAPRGLLARLKALFRR